MVQKFVVVSDFRPAGDQPQAIKELTRNIQSGKRHNVLLGVTGSGKTYVIARTIENLQRPTLVIAPNKILAAQLYQEFKQFFPKNAVEYFVSYYDYYQPEAYLPATDTYIAKDASINEQLDALRLRATAALLERRDVIIVASVSCIYNLGSPQEYRQLGIFLEENCRLIDLPGQLVSIQYERNDYDFQPGRFRIRGEFVDVFLPYRDNPFRLQIENERLIAIKEFDLITGKTIQQLEKIYIYPARHFVTPPERLEVALQNIRQELAERVEYFKKQGRLLEAQRLEQRTLYDLEMIREVGTCHGIENYSRHLSGRQPGERPPCLLDYFPPDYLVVIDESHLTIGQLRGMYEGDRSRKETLVEFGFRLPSALDNRPLRFEEFELLVNQVIYVSATPGEYELKKCGGEVVELIVRPTGLVDPEVQVRPTENQIADLLAEIDRVIRRRMRVLVTTLTKRTAEDLSNYLAEKGYRVRYLHSDIDAITRIKILRDLRLGEFDVLVGINLLREGLDLPEVSLVAVLDADKEGFLRSETSLIQVAGRAARNISGRVILYADNITGSIQRALMEMNRRRKKQLEYNRIHHIQPRSIVKAVRELEDFLLTSRQQGIKMMVKESFAEYGDKKNLSGLVKELERQMKEAADNLEFELAAALRDKIIALTGTKKHRYFDYSDGK